jgi:hypothetical protein
VRRGRAHGVQVLGYALLGYDLAQKNIILSTSTGLVRMTMRVHTGSRKEDECERTRLFVYRRDVTS